MNTRIAYKDRAKKGKDVEGAKKAKRQRLLAQDSAHKIGPGRRNVILETLRIAKNIRRNIDRLNAGRHYW